MASIGGQYNAVSRVASGNLTQYAIVVPGTSPDVFLSVTTGSLPEGVVLNKPNDNEHAAVVNWGHAKVLVANSLGPNISIMAGASGFAVAATSGSWKLGRLISGADSGLPAEAFITIVGTPTV